jgi:hypothetical protein
MWKNLKDALGRLAAWSRTTAAERRATRLRERFWADVRAGQREAEARSRP